MGKYTLVFINICFMVLFMLAFVQFGIYPFGNVPASEHGTNNSINGINGLIPFGDNIPALRHYQHLWLSSPKLPRILTPDENLEYVTLLKAFDEHMKQAGVSYFIAFGALLGSYMNHDFLPWDDEADILIRMEDIGKFKRYYMNEMARKEYDLIGVTQDDVKEYTKDSLKDYDANPKQWDDRYGKGAKYHRFKFYGRSRPILANRPWSWPFIDAVWYKENDTHIWTFEPLWTKPKFFEKNVILPLTIRPFAGEWFPAPHNTHAFLVTKYGKKFKCQSHWWNHKEEKKTAKLLSAPCIYLLGHYPVVHRTITEQGKLIETLVLNEVELYSVVVQDTSKELHGSFII